MTLYKFFSDFISYGKTEPYFQGVYVEITGIVIEIVLILIAVPIVLKSVERVRTRAVRSAVDFYLFQIFHKITRMFLDMASVKDHMPILVEELSRNPKFQIYGHYAYGNLENIIFVLKKTFANEAGFHEQLASKGLNDFVRYQIVCERCLDEIDRLVAMLVMLPKTQEELFKMRMLVYPLRDLMEEVVEIHRASEVETAQKKDYLDEMQRMLPALTEVIDQIFSKRRKLIDSMMEHRLCIKNAKLIALLPYVLVRRWFSIMICRWRKKPYRDFLSPSPIPDVLKAWRIETGFSVEDASAVLGITPARYIDYEFGYRQPSVDVLTTFHRARVMNCK